VTAEDVAAVILAGGRARRFGGQDKGLILLNGRPLVQWVADRLSPQVGEIVISANRNLADYGRLGCRVVADSLPDHPGPLAGILSAALAIECEWVLTSTCDTPFLPVDLVDRLLTVARDPDARVIRAADPGQVHYTLMLCHRSLLPDLAEYLAGGGRQVQAWQARHPCRNAVFDDPLAFLNINTPEDLQQAERLAGNRSA
jgi:molybdopterin-guanine dinucleotide biosynthesis protein A